MSAAAPSLSTSAGSPELDVLQRRIAEIERYFHAMVHVVVPIGVALLQSDGREQLLEAILREARELCNADGGTIYLCNDSGGLEFVLLHNDTLGVTYGGSSGKPIPFAPLPLRDPATGQANEGNVATYAALTGKLVNIADAYRAAGFDFSGTVAFDRQTGYRSTSFLTVPLRGSSDTVIGVLQLLNARDRTSGAVVPFEAGSEPIVESLSLLAAAALHVHMREESLRRQIRELHVRVDADKRQRQVAAIADTDYFQDLQRRARDMRRQSS